MKPAFSDRKLAFALALATLVPLVAMVAIGLATGATQEQHEHFAPPDVYARGLVAHADALRAVFACDVAFLVLYTGFFIALARYLHALGRPLAYYALAAMLVVTALDIVEDHHILAMLDATERGFAPDAGSITWQVTESATKFNFSYVALVLFGLSVPRDTRIGLVLAAFLVVGTLATAVLGYAAPLALRESLDGGRWLGFLIGFGLLLAWIKDAPEPAAGALA